MITGAHFIIFSTKPEADRAFLRDVLNLAYVDAGDGWLIFALPASEVAIHPADANEGHQLYLTCADAQAFVDAMQRHGITATAVEDHGWGLLTHITLPGGGRLGVYEARHARPSPVEHAG